MRAASTNRRREEEMKSRLSTLGLVLILTGLVLAGCGTPTAQPTQAPVAPPEQPTQAPVAPPEQPTQAPVAPPEQQETGGEASGVPNPASEYCIDQGGTLEIRTDESGNQYGVCILPDGKECEEWAFFRGECP